MKFNIGDKAWIVRANHIGKHIQCPDCAGRKFLTVILGDESKVTIDCCTCAAGYESPTGYISTYEYTIAVNQITIAGADVTRDRPAVYKFNVSNNSWNTVNEADVFLSESEALQRGSILKCEREKEEASRLEHKEKPERTWAWNATYHKREWKRALEQAAYHKSKLESAQQHVRSEKEVL